MPLVHTVYLGETFEDVNTATLMARHFSNISPLMVGMWRKVTCWNYVKLSKQ